MIENTPNLLSMEAKKTGRLCVSSDPSESYIYVDGIIAIDPKTGESKKTSSCIDIQEGTHDIVVRSEGYDDGITFAIIYPGKTTNINVNLKSGKPGKVVPFAMGIYVLSKFIPLI
jgi:hypothetical protein